MINFPNNPVDQQTFRVGQINYIWTTASQSWSAVKGFTNTDFLTYNRIIDLNPTPAISTITGALTVLGGVGVGGDIWAGDIYSNGSLLTSGGSGGAVGSLQTVTDNGYTTNHPLITTNATSSTNTQTGALIVRGGVGVGGDLHIQGYAYSEGGKPLYTPQIAVAISPPVDARVGDFWIDSNAGIEYQYIFDGSNYFWVQFVGL